MTIALIFSGMVICCTLLGVLLGHYLTLKGIAHVQPSPVDMAKHLQGTVTTEKDPWDYNERILTDEEEAKQRRDKLQEMGLDPDVVDAEKFFGQGPGMRPAGVASGGEDEK